MSRLIGRCYKSTRDSKMERLIGALADLVLALIREAGPKTDQQQDRSSGCRGSIPSYHHR